MWKALKNDNFQQEPQKTILETLGNVSKTFPVLTNDPLQKGCQIQKTAKPETEKAKADKDVTQENKGDEFANFCVYYEAEGVVYHWYKEEKGDDALLLGWGDVFDWDLVFWEFEYYLHKSPGNDAGL